ncbi:MAG TPA: molybdenum cofactor guanylyltransferase [Candidatus Dormibacteraeota bacterium]
MGEDVDLGVPALPAPALAGVVLCGGRSVRMGIDKATIEVGGTTLLARAVDRLTAVCDPVLIAPGGLSLGVDAGRLVPDALPDAGPLGGIVAALHRSPHPLLAVVAVDMPWIEPGLLSLLAARIGDCDVALCETQRGPEPLHAVYARTALPIAEAALHSADRSVSGTIARLRALVLTVAEWRAAGFSDGFARNLNTPADLAGVRPETRPPGT